MPTPGICGRPRPMSKVPAEKIFPTGVRFGHRAEGAAARTRQLAEGCRSPAFVGEQWRIRLPLLPPFSSAPLPLAGGVGGGACPGGALVGRPSPNPSRRREGDWVALGVEPGTFPPSLLLPFRLREGSGEGRVRAALWWDAPPLTPPAGGRGTGWRSGLSQGLEPALCWPRNTGHLRRPAVALALVP